MKVGEHTEKKGAHVRHTCEYIYPQVLELGYCHNDCLSADNQVRCENYLVVILAPPKLGIFVCGLGKEYAGEVSL